MHFRHIRTVGDKIGGVSEHKFRHRLSGAGVTGTMGNQFMRWAVLARVLFVVMIFVCGLTGGGRWTAGAYAAPEPPQSAVSFNVAYGAPSQVVTATIVLSNP